MPLAQEILPEEVAARAPVDARLMGAIRSDLYDHESRITAGQSGGGGTGGGSGGSSFKINGPLAFLSTGNIFGSDRVFRPKYRLDGAIYPGVSTVGGARLMIEDMGEGGICEGDVLVYTEPNAPIQGIVRQFSSPISSIGRVGSPLATQSIARVASQLSTQSIVRWRPQLNILSIVPLGGGFARLNLSGAVDTLAYSSLDSVTIASTIDPANSGTFSISRARDDGTDSVTIINNAAVAQSTAAGNLDLNSWKVVYVNPVPASFAKDEQVTLSNHTAAVNNGFFPIAFTNQVGNNIIIRSTTMVEQSGIAGTADTNRWAYSLISAAPANYAVGETANAAGHTNSSNNVTAAPIVGVNVNGQNNVVLYNLFGAVQAGAAGTLSTNRIAYTFAVDPSANINVGDTVESRDASSALNRGAFEVKALNVGTGFNVVVHNTGGFDQAGAGGTVFTHRALVKFATPQPNITAESVITLRDTAEDLASDGDYRSNNRDFSVLQVNRGGGSNYNAVISTQGPEQIGAAGRCVFEGKSIFSVRPSVSAPAREAGFSAAHGLISTNATMHPTRAVIAAGAQLMAALTQIPLGNPRNVTIQLG